MGSETNNASSPSKLLLNMSNLTPDCAIGPPSLQRGLPEGYTTRVFSSIKHLQHEVAVILEMLQQNPNGNQWLLVLGLSSEKLKCLCEDHNILGANYRIMWEQSNALIKVIPSASHEQITTRVSKHMEGQMRAMGISEDDWDWAAASKYPPCPPNSTRTSIRGKEGDQGLIPQSRMFNQEENYGWPTLVFETGVSQSLGRLREDAEWWFAHSEGDVRFVLIIARKPTVIHFELWQLAPTNSPRPLSRHCIRTLRSQTPSMPPLTRQPAQTQQSYCSQEVTVTPHSVVGAPLVLPFEALFCRAPVFPETDISIPASRFEMFATNIFH
ncbi:hypothetical protein PENANT_c012G09850 [Penicillium antarcticum]|uniref:Uncharacterized protein n=1 Tax=Penicillium antarcticum TaxID=416450 RepID=A0A1V6Q6H8_9EURO|nr:uncharacterized protein N7508_008046 [Penicillium antarcticum]KAJ5297797.1 hypothetical protein N7508_008046 [Penicillium antarcticum]OQD84637.1 hypothetical protein PENANT_c012G09850 [Penicillium antarcticum]